MLSTARQWSQANSGFLGLIPFTDKTGMPASATLINTIGAKNKLTLT
jgi:hypothetical protein